MINKGRVKIVKLIMIPTKKQYNQVYQRSFTLNANADNINRISYEFDKLGVKQGNKVPINALGSTLNDIINIDNTPIDKVYIPNGWQTQRIRYILEVESNDNGIITSSFIQGYSEYYDPSFNNNIDPNMLFYINSVTNVIRTFDPIKQIWTSRPLNTYNVLTDLAGQQVFQEVDGPSKHLIRPQDVNIVASTQDFMDGVTSLKAFNTELNGMVKTSKRSNNNQFDYINRTINGFIESKNICGVSDTQSDIYMNAASSTSDSVINNTSFFEILRNLSSQMLPNKFTLDILSKIDPTLKDNTYLTDTTELDMFHKYNTILDTEHTEDMLNPTASTIKAYTIVQTINSLMLDNLITSLSISISNETGEPIVAVTDCKSIINGIDITSYINRLVTSVKNLLIPKITDGGYTCVVAHVASDVLGDTSVSISINNQPMIPYRLPSYADGLYSPMINSYQGMQAVVSDFMSITEQTF